MEPPGQDLTLDAGRPNERRLARLRGALERRSLLRNAGYIMLTTGVNSALGYVFWLVVAHAYAPTEVGVAGALIAAMTVVAAIANLGTSNALIQRLPSRRTAVEWSRTLTASVATATLAGLVIAVVAAVAVVPELSPSLSVLDSNAGYVALFVAGVAFWSVSVVSDYLFVAERRSGNMLTRNLVFGVVKLAIVAAIVVVASDRDAIGIFAAWVIGCALSLAVAYVLLLPRLSHRYRP